jgi:hypothetical protein
MFKALYLKEWKEKSLLFFFELGILALLVLGQSVFRERKDVREWLAYAVLIVFFPFAALILGTGGFETEFRSGAWAYLFSRPVRRTTIWLAKFSAHLSMLAALWLAFAATWFTILGISDLAGGTQVLLGFPINAGFPWWSVWQSVFFLTVSFSLSLLHERAFSVLFVALAAGVGVTAAVWAVLNSRAGGYLAWILPERAMPTFLVGQMLLALAFAAASILTLVRSDFSQPRKQILGFVRWAAPLAVLTLAVTAAWALLSPPPGSRYVYQVASFGSEGYFETNRGIFEYSAAKDRIRWLMKAGHINYYVASVTGGKIAYTAYDIKTRRDVTERLWVENSDGTERKCIIGGAGGKNEWPKDESIMDLLISPDGTKVAILSNSAYGKRPRQSPPLWIARTDGTLLENLPDDASLFGVPHDSYFIHLMAWAREGNALILLRRGSVQPRIFNLWLYDLASRTSRLLFENAVPASWIWSVSPAGGLMAIRFQTSPEKPWRLALLDLKTLETRDITEGVDRVLSGACWNNQGDRLAFVTRRAQSGGPDAYILAIYSLSDQKVVAEKQMTTAESAAQIYSPSWTADGTKLVILDREANGLKILGPDLHEESRVPFPEWMNAPGGLQVVGHQAIVGDGKSDTLWRFDLERKSWKRIY